MSSTHDSSVLFALDELRQHENVRLAKESEKARVRAEVARRQAEAAVQNRTVAKRNAEELLLLRDELERKNAHHAELEAAIARLEVATRRPVLAAPPTRVEVIREKRSHHFLWTAALLFSCLGVFIATYEPNEALPEPVAVAALECPEPVSAAPASASAPAPAPAVVAPAADARATPRNIRKPITRAHPSPSKVPHVARPPAVTIDENCSGPLCGIPTP